MAKSGDPSQKDPCPGFLKQGAILTANTKTEKEKKEGRKEGKKEEGKEEGRCTRRHPGESKERGFAPGEPAGLFARRGHHPAHMPILPRNSFWPSSPSPEPPTPGFGAILGLTPATGNRRETGVPGPSGSTWILADVRVALNRGRPGPGLQVGSWPTWGWSPAPQGGRTGSWLWACLGRRSA